MGCCSNCLGEQPGREEFISTKREVQRSKGIYFQIDYIVKEEDGGILLVCKQAPIFRLQSHWSFCLVRDSIIAFPVTQQSLSVCKAFSQRCQDEEGLFCADGRLTAF